MGGACRRKKQARLNCIRHLLSLFEYSEVERPDVNLPERVRHADYNRHPVEPAMIVPQVY